MRLFKDDPNGITEGVIWRQMLAYFFPILLGMLFQQLYNTVDAVVVGQFVGKEALAAVGGSTGSIINLLVGLFAGLSSGATVVIAQYYGARDNLNIRRSVHTAAAVALAGGALLMVLGLLLSSALLRAMGTPADVFDYSRTYLDVFFIGIIPMVCYNIGSGILRAVGDSKRPLYFLIFCCVVNIVLDLLFVAAFGMGVFGVALATTISQLLSAVLVIAALVRTQAAYRLEWRFIRFHSDVLWKIFRIGLPAGVQSMMYSVSNLLIQAGVNGFGTDAMAAWTAFGKLDAIYWMTISSFGIAVTTFVGQNIGARKFDRARQSVGTCLKMSAVATVFVSALIYVFAEQFYRLFTKDPVVLREGVRIVRAIAPYWITYICVEVFSGALRGAGDSVKPMLITMFGICVLRIVWLYVAVPFNPDIVMVAYSYPVTWTVTSLLFIAYYKKGDWLKKHLAAAPGLETD